MTNVVNLPVSKARRLIGRVQALVDAERVRVFVVTVDKETGSTYMYFTDSDALEAAEGAIDEVYRLAEQEDDDDD